MRQSSLGMYCRRDDAFGLENMLFDNKKLLPYMSQRYAALIFPSWLCFFESAIKRSFLSTCLAFIPHSYSTRSHVSCPVLKRSPILILNMGGNAFPIPAQRLSTSHLNALFAYAQARLATIFSGGEIKMPRYAINKGSHGDLDILCPCDWAGVGMKGQESGLVDYASEIPPGGDTESAVEKLTTGIGLPTDPAKLNAFCDRVARALGAVKWIRGGYEISTAVPCHLVPGAETDLPPSNDVSLRPLRDIRHD